MRCRPPYSRLVLSALAATWFPPAPALANAPAQIVLCAGPDAAEARAAAELNRWLRSARVAILGTEGCPRGRVYRAELRVRGAQVLLSLRPPGRGALERRVPWLQPTDLPRPLSRLWQMDRLSALAVLVEGLLAEDRLALPARRPRGAPRAVAPTLSPAGPVTPPVPAAIATGSVAPARAAALERRPVRAPRSSGPPPPSAEPDWPVSLSLSSALRLRTPGLTAMDLAAWLSIGPVGLGLELQAPRTLRWAERSLQVAAAGASVGLAPRGDIGRGFGVEGLLAASLERVRLVELDAGARSHGAWLPGLRAGAGLDRTLGWGLSAGVRAEVLWSPRGRELVIPRGPTVVLHELGLRLALSLRWKL